MGRDFDGDEVPEEKPKEKEEQSFYDSSGRPYTKAELSAMERKHLAELEKETNLIELESLESKSKLEFGQTLEERMKTYLEGVEYLDKQTEEFQATKEKAEEIVSLENELIKATEEKAAGIVYQATERAAKEIAKIEATRRVARNSDWVEMASHLAKLIHDCGDEVINPAKKGQLLDHILPMLRKYNVAGKIDENGKIKFEGGENVAN